jgi:hypothetical protein
LVAEAVTVMVPGLAMAGQGPADELGAGWEIIGRLSTAAAPSSRVPSVHWKEFILVGVAGSGITQPAPNAAEENPTSFAAGVVWREGVKTPFSLTPVAFPTPAGTLTMAR